jgi:hypothetical protein
VLGCGAAVRFDFARGADVVEAPAAIAAAKQQESRALRGIHYRIEDVPLSEKSEVRRQNKA